MVAGGGTGKTKLLGCEALWCAVPLSFKLGRPVSSIILSGSDEQSKKLYGYSTDAITNNQLIRKFVVGDPLISKTAFSTKATIKAMPRSLKSTQGQHEDVVIVDEAGLDKDMDFIIDDSLRITNQSNVDRIILSGTPTTYNTKFVDMTLNPEKYPEWKTRYHWGAADCPNISAAKIEEAKRLSPDMYSIFWLGTPYAIGSTLIPMDHLQRSSRDIMNQFDPDYQSFAGIDWGYTAETVMCIGQVRKGVWYLIDVLAWRRPDYEDIGEQIKQAAKDYGVSNIYTDASGISENQRLEAKGLYITPIHFSKEKARMQSKMRTLFNLNKIRINEDEVDLLNQLRTYNWDTHDKDDRVDAFQLMLYHDETDTQEIYVEVI